MQIKEYRVIDKSVWGPGPWVDEPDKAQWTDAATGLPCLIVRNTRVSGSLCGYVGVLMTHPWFGKEFKHVDVDVHGGLSYSAACRDTSDESQGICHVPGEGEDDVVWWFGFDCAHAWDLQPMLRTTLRRIMPEEEQKYLRRFPEYYRDWQYVRDEVTRLAAQLKAAEHAD